MWLYKQKEFTPDDIPEGAYGFVYLMTAVIDGKHVGYIGKKAFRSNRKQKIGVREKKRMLEENPRSRKSIKRVQKLDYEKYYSSNVVLKEAHDAGVPIKRVILEICYSNRELSYYEVKYQFKCDVLESDVYLNDNILGKFFKNGTNSIRKQ